MLLLIVIGVAAICVLGLVCSWVLRARSGLDAMYQSDSDRASHVELDAQINAMHSRHHGGGGF